MAWRSRGKNNEELISQLELNGVIKNPVVKAAMLETDRKYYSPHNPYTDAPQTIGYNVTISAPHM
ncbi:Protein-L-isoaspartate(D-aspartate) O-methyltransferase, partial [Pseudolycoriella hygida]